MSTQPHAPLAGQLASVIRARLAGSGATQKALAQHLDMGEYSLTLRLQGNVDWKLAELLSTAAFLGISLADLVPGATETPIYITEEVQED